MQRDLLANAEILRHLSLERRGRLLGTARVHHAAAGEFIGLKSGGRPVLFVVAAGAIDAVLLSPEGRELIICERQSGSCLRLPLSAVGSAGEMVLQSRAQNTTVYEFDEGGVLSELVDNRGALEELESVSRRQIEEEARLIAKLAFCTVRRRLAEKLIELGELEGTGFIHMSHGELARWVGTSRQQVTEHLNSFRDHGLVSYEWHDRHRAGIRVEDSKRLSLER
jgi:CRP-like cAMP-binding protein